MQIELYYTPHTRAGRVRWLLEELQLPYTLRLPGMIAPYPPLLAYTVRLTARDAYARARQSVKSKQTGDTP